MKNIVIADHHPIRVGEVADHVAATGADLVLVSKPLSAIQERNIEQRCKCRVLDRTTLILDIFAQRARSHEGNPALPGQRPHEPA